MSCRFVTRLAIRGRCSTHSVERVGPHVSREGAVSGERRCFFFCAARDGKMLHAQLESVRVMPALGAFQLERCKDGHDGCFSAVSLMDWRETKCSVQPGRVTGAATGGRAPQPAYGHAAWQERHCASTTSRHLPKRPQSDGQTWVMWCLGDL